MKEPQNFVRKYCLTAELLISNIDDKMSRFPTQRYFHVFVDDVKHRWPRDFCFTSYLANRSV